ncbi:MAG: cytochrome d ubiquinol oxidase subunit II [Marinibacterium sp.]|nr:cytochrome d ubiquinol oxidase subunit II [Marinibacterium sp.]
MLDLFGDPNIWLPLTFAALLGVAILVYVVLDGFDLGVGLLFPFADDAEKDRMVASIGPFWDANETWLVLAIGLLLVAFPPANSIILNVLYLPVALMLVGLILRGVAFEFRVKAPARWKPLWNFAFFWGSLQAALCQGFMLGLYIMGLKVTPVHLGFACLTAGALAVGYSLIGACWLVFKMDGHLQFKAVRWARHGIWGAVIGMGAISIASPLVSPRIFEKWFTLPDMVWLAPLPLMSLACLVVLWLSLRELPRSDHKWDWVPFISVTGLNVLAFSGMAYSFYPYIVPEKLTIYEAASAPESLIIILVGALFVLPVIIAYSALSYYVFGGKATALRYD